MELEIDQKGNKKMKMIEIGGSSVYQFVWDYIDSNAYVVVKGQEALVIDPVDTKEFWAFLKDRAIQRATVVLTHGHFDHITGLNSLRNTADCKVYAHLDCSMMIGSTAKNLSGTANVIAQFNEKVCKTGICVEPFACAPAEYSFESETTFCWQDDTVQLLVTPGHSAGSICLLLNQKWLFSGDTLLGVPTITRLPGGSKKLFQELTLPMLEELKNQVKLVFPGHGETGTMEEMLSGNKKRTM